MHELPQLGKLERKYRDELTVIGVQSPKYPAEAHDDALRHAVDRYEINHAVVNDPDFRVWNDYAVRAWPTLVFVSPTGSVIGSHAGEAPFEALDRVMAEMVAEYRQKGALRPRPGPSGHLAGRSGSVLSYPGKVVAAEGRLFVADSGHHRVLECDLEGKVIRVAGSGEAGLEDGEAYRAAFNRPQGMALDETGRTLYIADSENHAVRALDCDTWTVRRVAGTGEQARRVVREGPAMGTPLSSPWDLAYRDGLLYIAMAGLHQIWSLHLASASVAVWAGTGHEGIRDGPRMTAWLAQPMGLALSQDMLYVACAESQAVQAADLSTGEVSTIVGDGLFAFGDEDGPLELARMQHNQGVAWDGGSLFVADTYNNKIKKIDLASGSVRTWAGSGRAGHLDGPGRHARFHEPASVSALNGTLYVADTNNHLIRTLETASGHVRTLAPGPLTAGA